MATVGTLLVNVVGNASQLATTLNAAERRIEQFGSRLFFMGSRITAGVTVPIAGFVAAVNKIGGEFDSAMTESLAIMDNVDAKMRDRMERRAIEISRNSKFAAKEVAEGYYDLASAGLNAEEVLGSIGTVTTFAQAGMLQMSEAGEFLAGAVRSIGLESIGAKDNIEGMARVADVLTDANNRALGTVKDFSQALTRQFGATMKTYNITLEDGVALLAGYAQNNIRGARASTLAMMATRDVMSATLRAGGAWKAYGISVFDASGELRKMPEVIDQIVMRMKGFSKDQVADWLLGKDPGEAIGKALSAIDTAKMFKDLGLPMRSVNALQQLLKSAGEIRGFASAFENATGAAARVAEKQGEAINVKWAKAFHGIQAAAIHLYNSFKPIMIEMAGLIEKGADKLIYFADKFGALDDVTKKWVAGLLLGMAATGPIIAALGSFILLMAGTTMAVTRGLAMIVSIGVRVSAAAAQTAAAGAAAGATAGFWTNLVVAGTMVTSMLRVMWRVALPIVLIYEAITAATKGYNEASKNSQKTIQDTNAELKKQPTLWQSIKRDVSAVSSIFSSLWDVVKFGWGQLGRLKALLESMERETWGRAMNALNDWNKGWAKTFDALAELGDRIINMLNKAGQAVIDFVAKIPVIGPILESAWKMGADAAADFLNIAGILWDKLLTKAKGYYAYLAEKAGAVVKEYTPQETQDFGNVLYRIGRTKGPNRLPDIADILRQWAGGMGALPPLEAGTLTPQRFMPLFPDMTRWARAPVEPQPGMWPDETPKTSQRDPIGDAYRQLMGSGEREWQNTFKAYQQHREEIKANEGALERLRDAYLAVRDEMEHIPELEVMFETDIAVKNMENLAGLVDTFWMDFAQIGQNMSNVDFFKKYGSEIEELSTHFTAQAPRVQHLIREYQRWQSETATLDIRTQSLIRSSKDLNDAANSQIAMTAKLADAEEELNQFRLSEGDRTLRGLTKNYEQMRLAFLQEVVKMVTAWQNAEPEYQASMERVTLQFIRDGQAMLGVAKRNNLERVASNLAANDLIKRSFGNMTDGQLEDIIKITLATRDWVAALGLVQEGMSQLAGVFDKSGEGILSWLAEFIGLLASARTVSTDLAVAGTAVRAAWKVKTTTQLVPESEAGPAIFGETEKTDWRALTAGLISVFNAVARGIALLDQATDSSSRARNIIGGIGVGSEIGKGIGAMFGPIGAMVGQIGGALVGALVGAFRNRTLRNIVKMTAKEWGTDISDELGKAIEETMKKVGGNRQVAAALHFGEILDEDGGLSQENFSTFRARLHDFFTFAATGLMPANRAMEEYTRNFEQFADYLIERGEDVATAFQDHIRTMRDLLAQGIIDARDVRQFFAQNFDAFARSLEQSAGIAGRAWQDVIDLIRAAGGGLPANVRSFFLDELGKAGSAWTSVVKGTTDPFKDLDKKFGDAKNAIRDTSDALKEANKAYQDSVTAFNSIEEGADNANDLYDEMQEKLADLTRAQDAYNASVSRYGDLEVQRALHVQGSKDALIDLGRIIFSTFNTAMADGLSLFEVMGKLEEPITALVDGWRQLKIPVDDPAMKILTMYHDMFVKNKPLFQGLDALTQGTVALSRLGGLNDQETFDAIQRQGIRSFRGVQAVTEQAGGTNADALRVIAPFLAQMVKANKEFGLQLDPIIQELIGQARVEGIIIDEMPETNDILTTGFTDAVQVLRETYGIEVGQLQALYDINATLSRIPAYTGAPTPGGKGGPVVVPPGTTRPPEPGDGGGGPGTPLASTADRAATFDFDYAPTSISLSFHVETQAFDQDFVQRVVIPEIEKAGTRNQRSARTKLKNGIGV